MAKTNARAARQKRLATLVKNRLQRWARIVLDKQRRRKLEPANLSELRTISKTLPPCSNPTTWERYKTPPSLLERQFKILDRFVEVRESGVPGGGKGVFAVADIPGGVLLSVYDGRVLKEDEVNEKYPASGPPPVYLLEMEDDYNVDGADATSWPRFINCSKTCAAANLTADDDAFIISKRDIKAGEELFWWYGEAYWTERGVVPK